MADSTRETFSANEFFGLDGRVVIVSGAGGGGIGTAVTRAVARARATVPAVSRPAAEDI